MRSLLALVWLETKIFIREPLGVIASVGVPVLLFVVVSRLVGPGPGAPAPGDAEFLATDLPVFVAVLITLSAVLSLVAIIAIYRESGILKRLRATPLPPATILVAHVLVKLLFTAVTFGLMVLAGRRFVPVGVDAPVLAFTGALMISTWSLLSLGFILASLAPTARFAQPLGAVLLYPMIPLSGLFTPVDSLPAPFDTLGRFVPLTYAVSLLRGIWNGQPWSEHAGDVAVLGLLFIGATAVASKVFRWE